MNKCSTLVITALLLCAAAPAMAFQTSTHMSMASSALTGSCGFTQTNADAMAGYADDPDYYAFFTSANHFDNCVFTDAQSKINGYLDAAVVDARNYQLTGAVSYRNSAYNNMGWAFHAAQDHYAHSNWVESQGALPIYLGSASAPSWWRSGVYSSSITRICPPGSKDHGAQNAPNDGTTLHKDHSGRTGYGNAYSAARAEIINQWGRLKSKIIAAYGVTNGNIIITKLQSGT